MTQQQQQQNTPKKESALSSSVLDRIEQEQVVPEARWRFMCMRCGMWIAWALSVILGAVATAVVLYVGEYARFALHEATHTSYVAFWVDMIPRLWVIIFASTAILAYYNLRHTNKGYRYSIAGVLVSSLSLSLVGGFLLYTAGVGYSIDTQLDKYMPRYDSLSQVQAQTWQNPLEGRLLGVFEEMETGSSSYYVFIDHVASTWSIETSELRAFDKNLLGSGKTVRILGTTTDSIKKIFHACGVFPWLFNEEMVKSDLRKERQVFLEDMHAHMKREDGENRPSRERREALLTGLCAEIAAVKRLRFEAYSPESQ